MMMSKLLHENFCKKAKLVKEEISSQFLFLDYLMNFINMAFKKSFLGQNIFS